MEAFVLTIDIRPHSCVVLLERPQSATGVDFELCGYTLKKKLPCLRLQSYLRLFTPRRKRIHQL